MTKENFRYWFAGLTDGEGCFLIDNNLQCKFRIALRDDDSDILRLIVKELGFGYYKQAQRAAYYSGGHWHKPTAAYCVTNNKDCLKLVKLFDEYPLLSKKSRDFMIWREAVIEANRLHYKKFADRSLIEKLRLDIKLIRKYKEA